MTRHALCAALLLALSPAASAADFTYRGQLHEDGAAASGRYDLQFTLYADREGSRVLHGPVDAHDVVVKDGQFAVALDLPDFAASGWLEVAVRPVDEVGFWPMGERELVSLKAASCPAAWELGGNAGTLPGVNFLGTTDDQPLVLRSNNLTVARLSTRPDRQFPDRILPNTVFGPDNAVGSDVRGATIAGGGRVAGLLNPNRVFDDGGTVSGGGGNSAGSDDQFPDNARFATVAGGDRNAAVGEHAVVAGGLDNRAEGLRSVVAGGAENIATGDRGTISGGSSNEAGFAAAVAGGTSNSALGPTSSVAGGSGNSAVGMNSMAAGGQGNCAGADYSFAAGRGAKVRARTPPQNNTELNCFGGVPTTASGDVGTFVWADSQNAFHTSTGPDQFLVRAQGGVAINAGPISDAVELSITADPDDSDFANIFLRQRSNNAGILFSSGGAASTAANDAGFFLDHFNGAGGQGRRMELRGDGVSIIRSNATGANTGVSMAANAGSWSSLSDRRLKTAITAIDPVDVLDRLVAIPIGTWSYIAQGEAVRHIGPMAQDFAAAFAVGENDTTISTIDADGVALAAIQGLNAKLERENAALREELQDLDVMRARMEAMDEELAALRQAFAGLRADHAMQRTLAER